MKTIHFWMTLSLLCAFSLSAHAGDDSFFSSRDQLSWFDCIEADDQPNTFYPEPAHPQTTNLFACITHNPNPHEEGLSHVHPKGDKSGASRDHAWWQDSPDPSFTSNLPNLEPV